MKAIDLKDIFENTQQYLDKEIMVQGFIRTNRKANQQVGFIDLNDGTCFNNLQIVYSEESKCLKDIEKLGIATAITAKGVLVTTPNAKQDFEMQCLNIKVEGESSNDYPLQKKRHSFEYLREIAHLRPRSNTFSAVFRIRSIAAKAVHDFFSDQNFMYIHTPIITTSDCEGAGDMFRVTTLDAKNPPLDDEGNVDYSKDFFARQTNLTVSGQLEGEAYAMAFKKIYTFGPTFRSENSNTPRHAAEFWMIESEVAFNDINDNMDLAEDMIKYIIKRVLKKAKTEIEFFNKFVDKDLIKRLNGIVDSEFERITYTKAIEDLIESKQKFEYPVSWGIDLQTEHERFLTEKLYKKPVFVTDYPKGIKAFYMKLNDDDKTVAAMDLLVPKVGEIIGGSQREDDYEKLITRMKQGGINPDEYDWYTDLRKYGGAYHSGYGLGFERLILYLTGMANIRDVIPFPRTPRNAGF